MAESVVYRRDSVTWTGFAIMGVWALNLYFLGPAAAAIGADLGLTDAAVGSIGTALAFGTMGSALIGPTAVRRWGRRGTLLLMIPGLAAAAAALAASVGFAAVVAAVIGIGLLGATTANVATGTLSDHHRRHAAQAITEANATASWLGVLSPVLLGFGLALPTGWRGAAGVLALLTVLVALRVRALPTDAPSAVGPRPRSGRLPRAFWPSLIVVSCAVAMEFSISFWAAPLIGQRTGVGLAAAATSLSALTLGMALARTLAAGLANRYPLPRLIVACFGLASLGLLVLLAVRSFAMSAAALFLIGLGLSLLFPYAQSWALTLAGAGPDRAIALTSVAAGVALGSAPLLLGVLAGAVGLVGALSAGFVIAALGCSATTLVAGLQATEQRSGGAAINSRREAR